MLLMAASLGVEDAELRAKEVQLAHRADVNYRIIDPNLH